MQSEKKCFLICPIGGPDSPERRRSDDLKEFIIEPMLEEMGIKLERADTISNPGDITTKVIVEIYGADLIIADLTERNPNVFYELAIAHALRKPVIHMIKKGEIPPFDVQNYRYINYDVNDYRMLGPAKKELKIEVEKILKYPGEILNPFTAALNFINIEKSGNKTDRIIAGLMEQNEVLDSRLRQVELLIRNRGMRSRPSIETSREQLAKIEAELDEIMSEISYIKGKQKMSKDDIEKIRFLEQRLNRLRAVKDDFRNRIAHGVD